MDGAERDVRAPGDLEQRDDRAVDSGLPDARAMDTREPLPTSDAAAPDVISRADRPLSPCTSAFTGGVVKSDLTLTKACSPYVIESEIVVQATLTIEAGVTVLFERGGMIVADSESGRLQIQGTSSSPVVFDSAADSPAPGDWAGVQIIRQARKPHTIQYATFRNCGAWLHFGCIWMSNLITEPGLSLDHVTIDGAKENGVDVTGRVPVPITNCTFRHMGANHYAVSVLATAFASIAQNNDFGGAPIQVLGGDINVDTQWKNPGTDVVVTESIFPGGAGASIDFTIGEGMRLLFGPGAGIHLGQGDAHLMISGTSESPVMLSSAAAVPQPGDWAGLLAYGGLDLGSSVRVSHATIAYAGGAEAYSPERGGVVLYGTFREAVITDTVITHSAARGLFVSCATPLPTLTGTTITSNQTDEIGPGPQGSEACR